MSVFALASSARAAGSRSEVAPIPAQRCTLVAWLVVCGLAFLAAGCLAPAAHAAFGVQAFDGQVTAGPAPSPLPDPGNPADPANFAPAYTQAGGHPYALTTEIRFNRAPDPINGSIWPDEPARDVLVNVPPGLVGNPTAVAQCRGDELTRPDAKPTCPPASQVGYAVVVLPACDGGICTPTTTSGLPVYSMVPPPDVPARFGFNAAGTVVLLDASVRTGSDLGVTVKGHLIGEGVALLDTFVTLWGTPTDPIHNPQRACPGEFPPTGLGFEPLPGPSCAAGVAAKPLLTMPTVCDGPLATTLSTDSWFNPGRFETASFTSHLPPGLPEPPFNGVELPLVPRDQWGAPVGPTRCDQISFDPQFTAEPDTAISPGPSAWTFDLTIPQDGLVNPNGIAEGNLKKAVVTLPEGVRVSPSSADGLGACSPAQIALKSDADPTCPDAAKVGSLKIDTPILDQPLTGSVYLATPHDNPSNSLIALYLVAKGPGVLIKLAGSARPDPKTGQLSATFDNIPQQPFSRMHLGFFGGPRASLSNPTHCGTYTTTAMLTSWSGKTVTSNSSFTTSHDGEGALCPAPRFQPKLDAGTTTSSGDVPSGGSYSSFGLTLSRSDDDEELAAIQHLQLPGGLLARIASVPLCTPARVAAGTCGDGSRIGSVTTTAGPGSDPVAVRGRVYLGGPYKGAPFSLSIVVPAKAGPFDLGTIVVRSALFVDRHNATLDAVTDPLPTILDGIPLQIRFVHVDIDRPKFIINPTSCNPKRLGTIVTSTAGKTAYLSTRFQIANCAALRLHPRMTISVGSKRHTGRHASTPLKTVLTQPRGETNLKSVSVTLPVSLNARLAVVNNACTQAQFDAGHCAKARAGSAMAVTPLLPHALRGGVFFVKDPTKPAGSLPNLVVALRGQVDFDLVGTVKIPHGELLSTRFTTVPDVPIKKFVLSLVSGLKGPLGVATDLCSPTGRRAEAQIEFRGQNGRLVQERKRLQVRGCGTEGRTKSH